MLSGALAMHTIILLLFLVILHVDQFLCGIVNEVCSEKTGDTNITLSSHKFYKLHTIERNGTDIINPVYELTSENEMCYSYKFTKQTNDNNIRMTINCLKSEKQAVIDFIKMNSHGDYQIRYNKEIENNCADQFERGIRIVYYGQNHIWFLKCINISDGYSYQEAVYFLTENLVGYYDANQIIAINKNIELKTHVDYTKYKCSCEKLQKLNECNLALMYSKNYKNILLWFFIFIGLIIFLYTLKNILYSRIFIVA